MINTFFLKFIVSIGFVKSSIICPNSCSGNGNCSSGATGVCLCNDGYIGIDCSQRLCPTGRAWFDFPSANNSAHYPYTECSNMGICDRTSGRCVCRDGFIGSACDRMACSYNNVPTCMETLSGRLCGDRAVCNGNGLCMSLRSASNYYLRAENNVIDKEYSDWDADMIHGCVCDDGYEGVTCDKMSCPKGDDPLTEGVSEIQLIECECKKPQNCFIGGFKLTLNGHKSQFIPFNATKDIIEYRLKELNILESFTVTIHDQSNNSTGATVCSPTNVVVTSIEILIPHGPHPAILVERVETSLRPGVIVNIIEGNFYASDYVPNVYSRKGTTDSLECSGHGVCDYKTGQCTCYGLYSSSNGFGQSGSRMDCGYRYSIAANYTQTHTNVTNNILVYNISSEFNTTIKAYCPFIKNAICAGYGTCDISTGVCTCEEGYIGADCSKKQCGSSNAWFGNVGKNHSNYAVCSGVGECNYDTGICMNCGGPFMTFTGPACQYMSCPGDSKCGGNGVCMSMSQAAHYQYNAQKELARYFYDDMWDSYLIYGCVCDRTPSVDNRYQDREYGYFDDYTEYKDIWTEGIIQTIEGLGPEVLSSQNFGAQSEQFFNKRFYRGPYALAATDFIGYNCQNALCPYGDNPLTITDIDEVQMLTCRSLNGTFVLEFRENRTMPIPWDASSSLFQHRLQQLYTISVVDIKIVHTNTSHNNTDSICNEYGDNEVYITFLSEHGDLPLLKLYTVDSSFSNQIFESYVNIYPVHKGTKEDKECSAMGICDRSSGICKCVEGFLSSNGTVGFKGSRGDCSYYDPYFTVY